MTFAPDDLEPLIPHLRRLARGLAGSVAAGDDLVQDALARAIERRDLFRGGKLRAWLVTILVNLERNNRRAISRRPQMLDVDDASVGHHLADRSIGEPGVALAIWSALEQLPDSQRETMLLLALEGMTYQEIGEAQGIPIGTVMSRISRARQTLKTLLEDGNIVPFRRTNT